MKSSINNSLKKDLEKKDEKISSLMDQIKKQEPIINDYNILKAKFSSLSNDLLVMKNEYEMLKSNKSFLEIELENKNIELENI